MEIQAENTAPALTTIGIDIGKDLFHVVGFDADGRIAFRRKIKRLALADTFKKLPRCVVGMEACLSAHFVSRTLRQLGHEPRIIPSIYVKPLLRLRRSSATSTRHWQLRADTSTGRTPRHIPVRRGMRYIVAARQCSEGEMMNARFLLAMALLPVFATQICAASELKIPAARYPILPESAAEVTVFVPTGWYLESKAEGDLNSDRIDDVVFVLREDNPANVVENPDGLGSERLNTNPRILGVAFRSDDGTNYRLALSNRTLVPRHEDPVLDDPFASPGSLELARGTFSLTLYFFASAGGWEMGSTKLTFRFQNDRFELIGLDRSWIHRGTGETTDLSINMSTGRISTTLGNIAEDEPRAVQWTSLSSKKRYAIDEITDAFRFDPRNP